MYHYVSFPTTSNTMINIPSIEKRKKCILLAVHLLKSPPEAIRRIPQIVTYPVVEKGIENKGWLR